MKFALVILEAQKRTDHIAQEAWMNTMRDLRDRMQKSGAIEALNESCLLCDLSSGLFDLSYIVSKAQSYGIQSRTLFFDQVPSFVITKGKDA